VVAVLCVCAAVIAAPGVAQSKGSGLRDCGNMPTYYSWNVQAKRVACSKAKDIAKRYDKRVAIDLEHKWILNIKGFHCVLVKIFYNGDSHRCTAPGGKKITWWRGKRESS
jgi:hypothetical protein